MPSIPGFPAPLKALTVVPFGMEEGTDRVIPNREFGLVVGQPAEFRFFTSAARKNDRARRPDRRLRRGARRALADGSELRLRRIVVRSRARVVRDRGHRDRHAAALVRRARRPPLEARIQCAGESASVHEDRHRPRHHQLRPGLHRRTRGRGPRFSAAPHLRDAATGRRRTRRAAPHAAVLPVSGRRPAGRRLRARAGRAGADASGALREILALQSRRRPHRQDPAVGLAGDRTRPLAGRSLRALHRQIPRRVGQGEGHPARRAGYRPHRARVVRRRGARADRHGRARCRPREA